MQPRTTRVQTEVAGTAAAGTEAAGTGMPAAGMPVADSTGYVLNSQPGQRGYIVVRWDEVACLDMVVPCLAVHIAASGKASGRSGTPD